MTQHGKIIITLGIGIFTAGALLWIILANWQWIAAGFAIFVGTAFTSLILSVETKNQPTTTVQSPTFQATQPNHSSQDNWRQPSTPPPDQDREEEESRVVAEDVNIDPYWGKQSDTDGTPS